MADKKFNAEWEVLPEAYKTKFLEIIEERGLSKDFDDLSDEHKSQILEIIKEHIFQIIEEPDSPNSDIPPPSSPPED